MIYDQNRNEYREHFLGGKGGRMRKADKLTTILGLSHVIWEHVFFDIKSFRSHYGPGVDSTSNSNEYQEYFLRGKGGHCVRPTTLPPSCAVVAKSGILNFLEPSGPLRVCNGTALPFKTLISWNPLGLSRPVMGLIYLYLYLNDQNCKNINRP